VAMDHAFVGRTEVIVAFLLAGATCFSAHWRTGEMVRRFAPIACIRSGSTTRRLDGKRMASRGISGVNVKASCPLR
jgi:hypothetical protein